MSTRYSSFSILLFAVMTLSSCSLFIDDELEDFVLPTYDGLGYEEPVKEATDDYEIVYQYNESTMLLHTAEQTQYIRKVKSDSIDFYHIIYYDINTPEEYLPKVGQPLISNNTTVFEHGLCDVVLCVSKRPTSYAVLTRHAALAEVFDVFEMEVQMPMSNYLDGFDWYDENGVLHPASVRPNATRAEWTGNLLPEIKLPINFTPIKKKHFRVDVNAEVGCNLYYFLKLTITGDWMVRIGCKGHFKLTVTAKAMAGMTGSVQNMNDSDYDPDDYDEVKLWENEDFLNGKVRIPVGPVVLVPTLGIGFYFGLEGSVIGQLVFEKKWDVSASIDQDKDVKTYNDSTPATLDFKFSAQGEVKFPWLKVYIGVGIGTSFITLRSTTDVYLLSSCNLEVGTRIIGDSEEDEWGEVDDDGAIYKSDEEIYKWAKSNEDVTYIDYNPKVDISFGVDLSVGLHFSSSDEVKKYAKQYEESKEKFDAAKQRYENTKAYQEQLEKLMGGEDDNIDNEALDELLKVFDDLGRDAFGTEEEMNDAAANIDKSKENYEGAKEANKKGKTKKSKILSKLSLGPYNLVKIPIKTWYLFPKMKDDSFRVGRKWKDGSSNGLIFTFQYELEDPGLICNFMDLVPGFVVKYGDKAVASLVIPGKILNKGTKPGTKYSLDWEGGDLDLTYTLIPCYYSGRNTKATIFNKGISFSTQSPSISVVKFTLDDSSVTEDLEGSNQSYDPNGDKKYLYTYKYTTYSDVKGARNIKEWGLENLWAKSDDPKRYFKAKEKKNGQYKHHWTYKTRKQEYEFWVRPYAYAKDDKDMRYFADYTGVIKWTFADWGARSFTASNDEDLVIPPGESSVLRLDSVEFIPDSYEYIYDM